VICSSLIARLFARVRFPITPTQVLDPGAAPAAPAAPASALARRVFGQPSRDYTGLFRMRHPTLITPREFDLSPFFDVIKFNPLARGDFDYARMAWAVDPADGAATGPDPATAIEQRPRTRSS
jgi:hypothetical protein